MPAIAHGMPNKKRKHAAPDEEEDGENQAPMNDAQAEDEAQGPKAKRAKTSESVATSPQKKVFKTGSRIPKLGGASGSKGKGVLSLSRLSMLARPKDRR